MTQFTNPRAESLLHHADLSTLAGQHQGGGLRLREERFPTLLILRASGDDADVQEAVQRETGRLPPTAPCSSAISDDGTRLLRIAPDELLILGPANQREDLAVQLRSELQAKRGAIVDVSNGYAGLHLSGDALYDVLRKSTSYDVHSRNFPPGKVVGTTFGKGQAYLLRTSEDSVLVIVRRSFADCTWSWLQLAAKEYGLTITA